jgi:hypothetical protein
VAFTLGLILFVVVVGLLDRGIPWPRASGPVVR